MPSERMPADLSDRERFPSLQEAIGEDPARWLDRPLLYGDRHRSSPIFFIAKRIQGIDRIAVCRAWTAVERRLDRGPREQIIDLLEERESKLREIGERPDRLPYGPRWPPAELHEHKPECQWTLNGEDWADVDRGVATVSDRVESAVATDGGGES